MTDNLSAEELLDELVHHLTTLLAPSGPVPCTDLDVSILNGMGGRHVVIRRLEQSGMVVRTYPNKITVWRNRSMMSQYTARPCPCGQAGCSSWHVSGVARVQGVSFTREQAEATAALLNAMVEAPEAAGWTVARPPKEDS